MKLKTCSLVCCMFDDRNPNTLTHDCSHLHINGYFCLETRPSSHHHWYYHPKTAEAPAMRVALTSWSSQTDFKVCITLKMDTVYIFSPHWQRKCTELCSWWQTRGVSTVFCWPSSSPGSRSSRTRPCSPRPKINVHVHRKNLNQKVYFAHQGSIYLTQKSSKSSGIVKFNCNLK